MDSVEFARLVVSSMPFASALHIDITDLTPQRVTATMAWAEERCTTAGILHGGALMAFADTAGAVCAVANLPQGASTSTIESKTNFFRAVREGIVTATSLPLHVGRTTIVVQTDLTDDNGKPVARVTQTQAVLAPR
ncbi:PaaI family thioesterase [Mycolicibacter senuensis]|uniref:Aromatic compound degradation protein PaaI n=1 Tax=Mycolicibacter senuensis TaxID=386913 RepID=A0A7I9XGW9_9MYCO|nr:PaaI family thioesterase [Mycolicibacter senuensis]MDQ2626527.1 PaaI family thioesterase [Actinomycetota bacterium]ORW65633.1 aromatic compound degradation protein PaaI [Mycolicibacter senuensis]GFG69219.1 aromatic compound degradation protein PaaI [Mycolicibacter senuensis]